MSMAACAEIVRKGDPDRFLAAMAAPPDARSVLLAIYAFNVEVARAPWVTSEPLIAQMRLQWWRDALDEIAQGVPVRPHQVATTLAQVIGTEAARSLLSVIDARAWDIAGARFEDSAALWVHLEAGSGALFRVTAEALGGGGRVAARYGTAAGLANWFRAVPALIVAGKHPLPNRELLAVRALAEEGLDLLSGTRGKNAEVPGSARTAFLAGWQTERVLNAARRDPALVFAGRLEASEFRRRITLLGRSLTGRW